MSETHSETSVRSAWNHSTFAKLSLVVTSSFRTAAIRLQDYALERQERHSLPV